MDLILTNRRYLHVNVLHLIKVLLPTVLVLPTLPTQELTVLAIHLFSLLAPVVVVPNTALLSMENVYVKLIFTKMMLVTVHVQ